MIITIKLYQENSLNNLVLEDFKSLASAVSFVKLFHDFTMRIKKRKFVAIFLSRYVFRSKRWLDRSGLYLLAKLKNSCVFVPISAFTVRLVTFSE